MSDEPEGPNERLKSYIVRKEPQEKGQTQPPPWEADRRSTVKERREIQDRRLTVRDRRAGRI